MPRLRLFYHFVWATKDRLPLIGGHREVIYRVINAKVADLKAELRALNGTDDHLHLVVSVPPTVPLSTFIGQVKGASSHAVTHLTGAASDRSFAWQPDYSVMTVSESHLPFVIAYVLSQQEHHAAKNLDDRFEDCYEQPTT
jgi:putative transposase